MVGSRYYQQGNRHPRRIEGNQERRQQEGAPRHQEVRPREAERKSKASHGKVTESNSGDLG